MPHAVYIYYINLRIIFHFVCSVSLSIMTKSVLLFLVTIGVGFVSATDMQSTATGIADVVHHAFSSSRSQAAKLSLCTDKQEEDILKDIPLICVKAATSLDTQKLGHFDPDTVVSFSGTFCKSECGNPLLLYFRKCINRGEIYAAFFTQLCAQNSKGDACYSSDVISALHSAAVVCGVREASKCCENLRSTIASIGCCANLLNAGGRLDVTTAIKSTCKFDVPGSCSPVEHLHPPLASLMGLLQCW